MSISAESLSFLKEHTQRVPADTPLRQKFDKLLGEIEQSEGGRTSGKETASSSPSTSRAKATKTPT